MYDFGFGTLIGDYIFLSFFVLCNTIALIVWILTLITGKHSFMDQLWPILPSVYTWLFVSAALFFNPSKNESISISSSLKDIQQPALIRILIIACFLTAWSVRLTFIFWRRGYYKWSFEDHRWDHIKKKYNYPEKKLAFHIFNFVFMAILQNWILFGYALPIWYLLSNDSTQTGLNVFDYIVLVAYVVFYLIEAIADEQQWRFQSNKYKWIADNTLPYTPQEVEDFQRGFLCRGIFAYSRHPNYFGDILLWWSVYFLTVSAKFSNFSSFWDLFNYSFLSAALMTLLFQQSVSVSEMFTARKYPEYTYYKTKVNRIIFGFRAYVPKKSEIEIDGE